ncbi:uncharacterized protein LOC117069618 [Trachypithecus francoisi]|uniref:uncharacterized protein LOC117069618 n=1 Tax=Trachypithecus francoisi TaxID=54180 RepID=UPI00141B619D|nr:uncharacterized protein LOC117069618 [Trachypithecus francoisi]
MPRSTPLTEDWQIQLQQEALGVMENPETAQVREGVSEGLTRPINDYETQWSVCTGSGKRTEIPTYSHFDERKPKTLKESSPRPPPAPALGLPLSCVYPEHPLVVPYAPAGRFVSGLALTSPHCVSHTVIHGCVLSSQTVHLQIEGVLGVVSGDGESALHRVYILFLTSIILYVSHPLQPLPWSLADPVHPGATEGESRGCTGESQGPPRLDQASPRLHQLHLTLDTCKHRDTLVRNHHTYSQFLSLIFTYIQLLPHESPLKIATRKTQLSPNSMVSPVFSVDHRIETPENSRAGAPRAAGSGLGCFSSAEGGTYLHVSYCIASSGVGRLRRGQGLEQMSVLQEFRDIDTILENVVSYYKFVL